MVSRVDRNITISCGSVCFESAFPFLVLCIKFKSISMQNCIKFKFEWNKLHKNEVRIQLSRIGQRKSGTGIMPVNPEKGDKACL